MLARIAEIYVNVLEPGFKIFLVVLVVAFLLYGFNLLRGGDKKNNIITLLVNSLVKGLLKFFQALGRATLWLFKFIIKSIQLLFATIRDFLRSEDL